MNEKEWLECKDPTEKALAFLSIRETSARKLQLFCAACIRRGNARMAKGPLRKYTNNAVRVIQSYADKLASDGLLWRALQAALLDECYVVITNPQDNIGGTIATMHLMVTDTTYPLLEIFGGYLQPLPVADPRWLAWNDGVVARMAENIYRERQFEACPILADALEEAGCANADILAHLRGPNNHVRGCWALDLLLGKQ